MLSIGGAKNQLTGTRSQDHDRLSLLPVASRKRPSRTPLSFGEAMEPHQWFWLGVMAGFIPCFVVLVVIVTRAYGCTRIRRRSPTDHNHS
jgi:heme/copper-type cytochrome/quinol oxidase subunit 2